jgi:hypothetical protein
MLLAISNGFALEQLLEPDAVDDELYGKMLLVFFRGSRRSPSSTRRADRRQGPRTRRGP